MLNNSHILKFGGMNYSNLNMKEPPGPLTMAAVGEAGD